MPPVDVRRLACALVEMLRAEGDEAVSELVHSPEALLSFTTSTLHVDEIAARRVLLDFGEALMGTCVALPSHHATIDLREDVTIDVRSPRPSLLGGLDEADSGRKAHSVAVTPVDGHHADHRLTPKVRHGDLGRSAP